MSTGASRTPALGARTSANNAASGRREGPSLLCIERKEPGVASSSPVEARRPESWRPRLIGRITFALLGLFFIGLAVLALVVGIAGPEPAALICVPFAMAFGIPLLLAARMRITVGPECLEYRNFGAVRTIRWGDIRGAAAGYYGITLTLDGLDEYRQPRTVIAMAVQRSNLAQWFEWHTRADRLVALILDRAQQAGGDRGAHPVV
jgi:hypothetical protein